MLIKRIALWIAAAVLITVVMASTVEIIDYYQPTQAQAIQQAKNHSQLDAINILASERVAYYTKVLSVVTGALAAFGLLQIFFLIRADDTARISANAAKDSADALKAQERAYLFIRVELKSPITVASSSTKNYGKMVVVNHGKTPAVLKSLNGLIGPYSAFPEQTLSEIQLDIPGGVQVIGPAYSEFFDLDFFLNQEQWNAISSLNGMLLAVGHVQYEDIFGEMHATGFCWQYQDRLKDFYPANNRELNYYD